MAYGTANATFVVQPSPDHADATHYIAILEFSSIPDGVDPGTVYTVLVSKADVDAAVPQTVGRDSNEITGNLYVRSYAAKNALPGLLSNELVFPFDFRLQAPVIVAA